MAESLKLTIKRTLPYWNNVIVPQIKVTTNSPKEKIHDKMNTYLQAGKKIIIAAHGNSLRGVVKHLDNMSDEDIMGLNLPTGIPFVYELDENMKPIVSMKFLGDEETVRKAIESVAAQVMMVETLRNHQKFEKSEKILAYTSLTSSLPISKMSSTGQSEEGACKGDSLVGIHGRPHGHRSPGDTDD